MPEHRGARRLVMGWLLDRHVLLWREYRYMLGRSRSRMSRCRRRDVWRRRIDHRRVGATMTRSAARCLYDGTV